MQLVERQFINNKHQYYQEIDIIAFKSKNLYNFALYTQNQYYLNHKIYLDYNKLANLIKNNESYKALPSKVSQQILLNLHRNWLSYFSKLKLNLPNTKPPQYKHKTQGRNILVYTKQAIGKNNLLSKTNIKIKSDKEIQQVRIINKRFGYIVEIVYEQKEEKLKNNKNIGSIDLGINNLVTITSNCAKALIINGRILKSYNQYYNKLKSRKTNTIHISKKRYFRIQNYFHHVSKIVVEYCNKNNISNLVIGYNEGWKQNINIGKINNQKFCYIPFLDLVTKIEYKCKLNGIKVTRTEESYTSKCSYYDKDNLDGSKISGKRKYRGLYYCKDKSYLNADINGSLNIGRKVFHGYEVDRSLVARPIRISPYKHNFL